MQHQFGAEIAGQHVLGEVVFGGAQAAGHQHHVGALPGQVQGRHDFVGAVRNAGNLLDTDAELAQLLAHKGRVGVDDLTVE